MNFPVVAIPISPFAGGVQSPLPHPAIMYCEYANPTKIAKIHTDLASIYTKKAWNPSDSEKSEMQDFVDT
jgi:hypothetical protein